MVTSYIRGPGALGVASAVVVREEAVSASSEAPSRTGTKVVLLLIMKANMDAAAHALVSLI